MQSNGQLYVQLSKLVSSRRNPRKVKPAREAHNRLVALIRSHGLLQPLVVRPMDEKPKHYLVIAGNRRLAALRELHRGDGDPKIPCVLRSVDTETADALSLGENFGRESMHPLDEAEAFAKLARGEGKGADAIAAEFGVTPHYVLQRMKLAGLAEEVKSAYRENAIDTATAEAFASVPEDKQREVWGEVNGHPRHAEHVRNIIANEWIDASSALFDLSVLPDSSVSRDLFSERVLVERRAFMDAQIRALDTEKQKLSEDGWREVVTGRREDIHDRLLSMDVPEREYDEATSKTLAKITKRKQTLEALAEKAEGDESRLMRLQSRYDRLETEEHENIKQAPVHFSEETKAIATAFLMLDADGRVHHEYRVPKRRHVSSNGRSSDAGDGAGEGREEPPTSDDLSDKQLAVTFTHQALAVREALLRDTKEL